MIAKRQSNSVKRSGGAISSRRTTGGGKKSASSLVRFQLHIPKQAAVHVWGLARQRQTPISELGRTALTFALADVDKVTAFWFDQLSTGGKKWPDPGQYATKVVVPKVLRLDVKVDRTTADRLRKLAEAIGQTIPQFGGALIAAYCAAPQFAALRKKFSRATHIFEL